MSEAINALLSVLEVEQERLKPDKKNINTPSARHLPSDVYSPARTLVDCSLAPLKDVPPRSCRPRPELSRLKRQQRRLRRRHILQPAGREAGVTVSREGGRAGVAQVSNMLKGHADAASQPGLTLPFTPTK